MSDWILFIHYHGKVSLFALWFYLTNCYLKDNTTVLRQVSLSPIISKLNSPNLHVRYVQHTIPNTNRGRLIITRKLALGIIRNLSSTDENESVLVSQGALRPLLHLLDTDIDLSTRIEVLKTIRNLSFAPDSKVEIKRYKHKGNVGFFTPKKVFI